MGRNKFRTKYVTLSGMILVALGFISVWVSGSRSLRQLQGVKRYDPRTLQSSLHANNFPVYGVNSGYTLQYGYQWPLAMQNGQFGRTPNYSVLLQAIPAQQYSTSMGTSPRQVEDKQSFGNWQQLAGRLDPIRQIPIVPYEIQSQSGGKRAIPNNMMPIQNRFVYESGSGQKGPQKGSRAEGSFSSNHTVSSGFQLPANYVERSSIRTKEEAEAILNERTDDYGKGSPGQPQLAGNVMLQSPPKNLHPIVTSSFSPLFTSVPKDDFAAIQKDMISDQPYLYNPRKEVPHQFDAQKVNSGGVGQGNELLQAVFNPKHYTGDLATRQSPRNGQLQNIPSSWTGGYQSNMPSSSPSKRYETQNRTLIEVKTSYPKGLPENKQDRELKAAAQEDKSKENKIHHGFKMMKEPLNKIQTVEHRIEEDLENLEEALVHRLQFGETHPKPGVKMTREEKIALRRAEHKAAVRAEIEKEIEELLNASRKK